MNKNPNTNPPKILLLSLIRSYLPQILNKIEGQFKALKTLYPNTSCVVLGHENTDCNTNQYSFRFINTSSLERNVPGVNTWKLATDIIHGIQPTIVYMRYPTANPNLLKLVQTFPQNIIFEHQAKEPEEIKRLPAPERYRLECQYGASCLDGALALVGVTREIKEYQEKRLSLQKPTLILNNGIDASFIPLKKKPKSIDKIHILITAQFNYWHGLDRLIKGMVQEPGQEKIQVHLVGFGSELENYKRLIIENGLKKNFTFEGYLTNNQINDLADQCHVGVGYLAPHRKGLTETTALKHREYCLRGMPFAFSGDDPDFPISLPFIHTYEANEIPIPLSPLIQLAQKANEDDSFSPSIREYGLRNLQWNTKMAKLLEFIKGLKKNVDWQPNIEVDHQDTGQIKTNRIINSLLEDYYQQGIRYLQKMKQPTDIEMYRLASLYQQINNIDTSISLFSNLYKSCRNLKLIPGIHFHLGQLYLAQGNKTKAEKQLNLCLRKNPQHKLAKETIRQLNE